MILLVFLPGLGFRNMPLTERGLLGRTKEFRNGPICRLTVMSHCCHSSFAIE